MKKLLSFFLAVLMLFSVSSAAVTQAATLTYAEQKLEQIQKTAGFIPGKTAAVTGNCYGFISKVCEKLYGKAYQEQLISYTCKHTTGLYYEVAKTVTSSDKSANSTNIKNLIQFLKNNALPGDVVHYASISNPSSKHTFMVQSIDNEKIRIFHSNYGSDNCQIDTVYWNAFLQNPTKNTTVSGVTSRNTILTAKMGAQGLGISVNRFTNYSQLFIAAGPSVDIVPKVTLRRVATSTVRASWNPVSGATKYQVNYKAVGDSGYTMASNSVTANYLDIGNLEVGREYDIRVRAYAGKWMTFSATQTIKALPPEVTDASVTLADKGIAFAWPRVSDITGVRVYKKDESTGKYAIIKEYASDADVSYIDTRVEYGKTYDYQLQRYLVKNGKTYGSGGVHYRMKYELKTPKLFYDRNSASSVTVTADTDGAQRCLVYYAECDGKKVINNTEVNGKQWTLSSLEVGKEYTVYCAEKTTVGRGEWGKLTFTAAPKAIEQLRFCGLSDGLRVIYDAMEDADGYEIYRSESAEGPFEKIGTVPDGSRNYYNDKTIKINTPYYYRAVAFVKLGTKTVFGDMLDDSFRSQYNVTVPANVKAACTTASAITVSYQPAVHQQSYTLQYYADGGRWQTVKGIRELNYTVRGLSVGKTYHFRVCAVNTALGSGEYSAVKTLRMMPPVPKIKSVKKVKKSVKVTFTKVEGVSGYAVFRAASKNGKYKKIAVLPSADTTSYTDKNVKAGKTYYYKVWSYVLDGQQVYRSAKSAAVKLKYS